MTSVPASRRGRGQGQARPGVPAELLTRFTHVTRVWIYTQPANAAYMASARATPVDKEEMSLVAGMKLVRRWADGDKMLLLYEARQ